jgi:hypothetical protein
MMPDGHDAHSHQGEERVTVIVARCGNIFTRFGLSPPWGLRDAARHWTMLSPDEVARIVLDHMDLHRAEYHSGSGDELFHLLERAIRQALAAKHPRPTPERQPERPQRPRNQVIALPTAGGGLPDLYLEGAAASPVRDQVSNVERPSGLPPGYDAAGEPIEDDEAPA